MSVKNNQPAGKINEDAVNKFLENQSKQLELADKELELQKKELEINALYAGKTLTVNEKLLTKELENKAISAKNNLIFVGIMTTIFLGTIVYLGVNNAKDLSEKLLTIIVPAILTGFGGYQFGLNKGKNSKNDNFEMQ